MYEPRYFQLKLILHNFKNSSSQLSTVQVDMVKKLMETQLINTIQHDPARL